MADLLSLVARIGIDDSEYNKGIDNAESKASKLGKGLKTAGKVGAAAIGVTAGAIAGMSKKLADGVSETAAYGDNIDKMSQKLGISSKAYQEWDAVLQHSGTSISAMKPAMKTLQSAAQKNSEAFTALGMSQEQLASMSKEELFDATIKGLQGVVDANEKSRLATELLGKGAVEMGALLNTSAEDTQAMKDRVNELGGVMGEDAVKNAAAFQDSLKDMQTSFDGLKRNLLSDFMPAFTGAMDGLTEIFAGNTEEGIEKLSGSIEEIVTQVVDKIPTLLDVGSNIVLAISESVMKNLPQIVSAGFQAIMTLSQGLLEQLPLLLSAGLQILLALVQGITENIPQLLPAVIDVITQLATMLTNPEMLTQLIMASIQLIVALADGLLEALPKLIEVLPKIISNVVRTLIKLAPKLIPVAFKLIGSLITGLFKNVGALGKAFGEVIGIIPKAIAELSSKALTWGKDLIQNFIDGIKSKFKAVKDSFSSIADVAKSLLGHSTPTEGAMKNDDEWMPDFIDNLANGINKNKYKVTDAIDSLAGDMVIGADYGDGYGYEDSTQQFEFTFADGNAPLLQIARLLFPYMKVVAKEKSGKRKEKEKGGAY